jgi:hypothetical protein
MQHHSTTTTFLFLELLSVNTFPNAAIHTKIATCKGALTPRTFPRKKKKETEVGRIHIFLTISRSDDNVSAKIWFYKFHVL